MVKTRRYRKMRGKSKHRSRRYSRRIRRLRGGQNCSYDYKTGTAVCTPGSVDIYKKA